MKYARITELAPIFINEAKLKPVFCRFFLVAVSREISFVTQPVCLFGYILPMVKFIPKTFRIVQRFAYAKLHPPPPQNEKPQHYCVRT